MYKKNRTNSKSGFSCAVKTLLLKVLCKKMIKKYQKSHKKVANTCKQPVKIANIFDFSSLGVHISRFCANSAKFSAVARPDDGKI